jgi:exopolysaccharide biosynthesis polyprenyl glycosylphosphotransferase
MPERSPSTMIVDPPAPASRCEPGESPASSPPQSSPASPRPTPDHPSPRRLRALLVAADVGALLLGLAAAFAIQAIVHPVPSSIAAEQVLLVVASLPGFALGALWNQLYLSRANERAATEFWNIVRTVVVGVTTLLVIAFVTQYPDLSRLWVGIVAASVTAALVLERAVARMLFRRLRAQRRLCRPIVIVGTDRHALSLADRYRRHPELGYDVVGIVGSDHDAAGRLDDLQVPVLGGLADVDRAVEASGAVGVVISLHSVDADEANSLTRHLTDARYHVALSSSLCDIDISRLRPQVLDGCTLIYVEQVIRGGWRARTKRLFDIALAATILAVTTPVLAASAVAIRLTSPGPALFRQTRVGKDGEPFEILKLRTMTVDAERHRAELAAANEADGPLFKMSNDPRVTPVGRWLRKLSIDELPQLVCVLRGTMSMVGPRPALPDEVREWDPEVRARLRVLPGLTGLWQVSGRADSSFEQYKRLDLYYVDNWSITHDVRICARTVGAVLGGRGAS